MSEDVIVDWLADVGLGLGHDDLRLHRATRAWLDAGGRLCGDVSILLDGLVAGVEHIGSSSVAGILAKPIVDLAIGVTTDHVLEPVRERLESAGWLYRGDAGDQGGHVFVLESAPWHRVAHAHVVDHLGVQWSNYVRLRDLLRRSLDARQRYEDTKVWLVGQVGGDRQRYTDGKTDVVTALLRDG